MKQIVWLLAVAVTATLAGVALERFWLGPEQPAGQGADRGDSREVLYWVAPMDSNYRRDRPGKSPMGMDLVPVYAGDTDDAPGTVRIDPVMASNLGVRTATARQGVLHRRVEALGYVAYDRDALRQINTRVEGWVERLAVKSEGEPVSKGQVLFEIYSPTLVNAQEEYLATLQSRNTGLRKASRERLLALGITKAELAQLDRTREVRQRVRVTAPVGGVVAALGVQQGAFVTPNTTVMSVAGIDQVWVLADVLERQAASVSAGQKAEIRFDALPGDVHPATIDYVYPELDPRTRTLPIRFRLENAAGALRPNMVARVTVLAEPTAEVVHVPLGAIIRGGAFDRVVLALDAARFQVQAVTLGIESGDRIEIKRGVEAGDEVVTSGQFLIDSESNLDAGLSRFEATPEAPGR